MGNSANEPTVWLQHSHQLDIHQHRMIVPTRWFTDHRLQANARAVLALLCSYGPIGVTVAEISRNAGIHDLGKVHRSIDALERHGYVRVVGRDWDASTEHGARDRAARRRDLTHGAAVADHALRAGIDGRYSDAARILWDGIDNAVHARAAAVHFVDAFADHVSGGNADQFRYITETLFVDVATGQPVEPSPMDAWVGNMIKARLGDDSERLHALLTAPSPGALGEHVAALFAYVSEAIRTMPRGALAPPGYTRKDKRHE